MAETPRDIGNILTRYKEVSLRIEDALQRTSRPANSVNLLVVTKRQPVDLVAAIAKEGLSLFGENYPEEAVKKIEALNVLGMKAEWHLIGPLQQRKTKMAVQYISMIHSVDRLSIAEKINHYAKQFGKVMPILLQFNMSGEERKAGWSAWNEEDWESLIPEIKQVCRFSNLLVKGLMTMPPFSENPESSRPFYQQLRDLQGFLQEKIPDTSFSELSTGTSFDYVVAVEEGATFVRIGEAILGPREISKGNQ